MGLSLGNFLWSIVLLLNSVAILNEERFLVRSTFLYTIWGFLISVVGWSRAFESHLEMSAFKRNAIHLITSMRTVLRSFDRFKLQWC